MKKILLMSLVFVMAYGCQDQQEDFVDINQQKVDELSEALGMKVEEVSEEEMQNGLFIPYEDLLKVIENRQIQSKATEAKLNPSPLYFSTKFTWKSPNEIEAKAINSFTLTYGLPITFDFKLSLRGDGVNYKWNFDTKIDLTQVTLRTLGNQQNFIGKVARNSSSKNKYDIGISVRIDFYTSINKKNYHVYGTLGLGITIDDLSSYAPKNALPCDFSVGVLF